MVVLSFPSAESDRTSPLSNSSSLPHHGASTGTRQEAKPQTPNPWCKYMNNDDNNHNISSMLISDKSLLQHLVYHLGGILAVLLLKPPTHIAAVDIHYVFGQLRITKRFLSPAIILGIASSDDCAAGISCCY